MTDHATMRHAALVHASIPPDTGLRETRSPLVALIPDDVDPTPETWALVEEVVGHPVEPPPLYTNVGATPARAARLRAACNRWGIRQVGIMAARDHVRTRELWRGLNRA